MLKDLDKDQLLLAELMSEISEAGFSAGWMKDMEFDLWSAINGGDGSYGRHILTQAEIDQLLFLSNKCRCWIVFDDENEETAVDLDIWKEMFAKRENSTGNGG
jgi:hypothetical protein